MISATRLAWLQLRRERLRLAIALAGVAFAVILVFMQLGFQDALFQSSVAVHSRLLADVVLISPQSAYLASMKTFPRRRLYQALGFEGVESVSALYTTLTPWKNPVTSRTRDIFVAAFNPAERVIALPEVDAARTKVRRPDVVIFDEASRPEFGAVAASFKRGLAVETEVNTRHVTVAGLFTLGTSFGIDGTLVTSDLNFLRIFPQRAAGAINIGLVRLRAGTDPRRVRDALRAHLPHDVEVLTKADYMQREMNFWATSTPIGYVLGFGVIMGLVVGAIIVYQILFADISDHLAEYATLKAMGYTSRYLFGVVLMEASILAVVGYVPGAAICAWLYRLTESATLLPMRITPATSSFVLALTLGMCWASGAVAARKLRSADPAEIF
jgi:putative ABC transport system permease protein